MTDINHSLWNKHSSRKEPSSSDRHSDIQLLEHFIEVYQNLNLQTLDRLDEIYHPSVVFQDPVHQLTGLPAVKAYFQTMYANLQDYRVEVTEVVNQHSVAYINWTIQFQHSRLNRGKVIRFGGVSRLEYDTKIFSHIDYFDLGSMLYEQLPVVGAIVRFVKSKIGS
jgi:hypothetical protein